MFIDTDGAQIFAISFGPSGAPPLLALGGWIGSWEDWAETLSLLSENWRVLAFDHRGSGITRAALETLTMEHLVQDVFRVMDAFQLESCVLAGMSMGAGVAFQAALRQPERFYGLVIANGLVQRDPVTERDPFLHLLKHDYTKAIEGFIQLCIPEPDCEHIKDWGRQILGRATPEAAVTLYRLSGEVNLLAHAAELQLPTLVLHSDQDRLVPLSQAQQLVQALPDAQLTVIKGAGHVPILTRPAEVSRAIQDFFGERKFSRLERSIQVMPDFVRQALMEQGLMLVYQQRPAYQQNDYLSWIVRAKRPETQQKRLAQMLDELAAGDSYMKMPFRARSGMEP